MAGATCHGYLLFVGAEGRCAEGGVKENVPGGSGGPPSPVTPFHVRGQAKRKTAIYRQRERERLLYVFTCISIHMYICIGACMLVHVHLAMNVHRLIPISFQAWNCDVSGCVRPNGDP